MTALDRVKAIHAKSAKEIEEPIPGIPMLPCRPGDRRLLLRNWADALVTASNSNAVRSQRISRWSRRSSRWLPGSAWRRLWS